MKTKCNSYGNPNSEIVFVGDFPDRDAEMQSLPMAGRTGDLFDHFLSTAGINREDCYITNVCNYHPYDNQFASLKGTPQLSEGLDDLNKFFHSHFPTIIVPMGGEALNYFYGDDRVYKWRGSVLPYKNSLLIPIVHPYDAFADGSLFPIIDFDLRRVKRVLLNRYTPPVHKFIINPDHTDYHTLLKIVSTIPFISMDIETVRGTKHILCVGVAIDKNTAICFKNPYPVGLGTEQNFASNIRSIIEASKSVTFHNGMFDVEVLRLNGIPVPEEKYDFDTMYAQRVIAPELPIGLDFCTSIYTDEPYYKDEGKENSSSFKQSLWEYNCKDCITTFQIREKQSEIFKNDPVLNNTFKFQMSMLPTAFHIQTSGMLVDDERCDSIKSIVEARSDNYKALLFFTNEAPFLTSSPKQVAEFLYKKLGLPTRTSRKSKGITTNEDAVVSLIQYCQKELETKSTQKGKDGWQLKLYALKLLLLIKGDEKLLSTYLNIKKSGDGRIRSFIKLSGTETGRWAAGLYVDGTGWNNMTAPRSSVEVL